ncbi:NVEALA domain-containing protein [Albibacterium indicum]|uniref:NVEALA domain-containing protein n=1 Tax=Albibacterium indicum TaxID=2292082 RepID=UPI000E46AD95|nr:NVEALA domain-containing protein [Pedobacter indicus]
MKKKILTASAAIVVALFAAINLNIKKDDNNISMLTMNNIEALATGEEDDKETCYNTITTKEGSQVRYCQTCEFVDGTYAWNSSSDKC